MGKCEFEHVFFGFFRQKTSGSPWVVIFIASRQNVFPKEPQVTK
jgi:hypothetical protein